MQELEHPLSFIHPATLSGALIFAGAFLLMGVIGTLVIRAIGHRTLRLDRADRMAVAVLGPLAQIAL